MGVFGWGLVFALPLAPFFVGVVQDPSAEGEEHRSQAIDFADEWLYQVHSKNAGIADEQKMIVRL